MVWVVAQLEEGVAPINLVFNFMLSSWLVFVQPFLEFLFCEIYISTVILFQFDFRGLIHLSHESSKAWKKMCRRCLC